MSTITIHIDNKPYTVRDGQNLLAACLSLGFNVPYFCWHPAMHSVGACRQCAVKEFKDEKDTRGRIVMSCMTPVKDGMRISIEDPEAKSFRKSIIEFLMLNHPHDCPVCDEGSECHLQDMTVMTGHAYRRTRFKKRTYRNQYLGPFVTHEMNRCIQCYRCVRFYRDYAGGRDFNVFGTHDYVYFGRHREGVLENEFSGNLVEICPTGVFTDKTFQKHYTRKWDLQTAPSICVHCGVGCNTIPGERYGELRRVRTRYNGEVNRYFLCDRGRYGYEFVNNERRICKPMIRNIENPPQSPFIKGGSEIIPPLIKGGVGGFERASETVSKETILDQIKKLLAGGKGIIGIGSPRASLESNFAVQTLVGQENFYNGMRDREAKLVSLIIDILKNGPARSPSLREVESCDAVFVLGEDVTNTAPVLALSLRQAIRQKSLETARKMHIPLWDDAAVRNATQDVKGSFFTAAPYRTKLDELAVHVYHAAPDDIARFGFAVARELNSELPAVPELDNTVRSLAVSIAQTLKNAQRPLIVSGIGCGSETVIQAAANIAWALCSNERTANLSFALPECNALGISLMAGGSLDKAFQAVQDGKADTSIILENDLFRNADEGAVNGFFGKLKHSVVIEHLETRTTLKADAVLPAATFAEADGTFVNNEGRAQRFYQVFVPQGEIQESWRWLRDIAQDPRAMREWQALDSVTAALSQSMPVFKQITEIAPPAGFRIAGMKIPRKHHRYSGRTAMYANVTVFEPKPPKDPDSPLAFTMEGYQGEPPSSLIPRFWAPQWNSPQAINKFQVETGGPLHGGDPGIRLIEPSTGKASFFKKIPEAFTPRKDTWLFVPVFHIFGSDELSARSPGVAELTPRPYVGLNLEAAGQLTVSEGEEITVALNGTSFTLPVKHVHGLPAGLGVLPVGLPGMGAAVLPAWGSISTIAQRAAVRP